MTGRRRKLEGGGKSGADLERPLVLRDVGLGKALAEQVDRGVEGGQIAVLDVVEVFVEGGAGDRGAFDDGGDRGGVVSALGDDADERCDQPLSLVAVDELRRQAVPAGRQARQVVGQSGLSPGGSLATKERYGLRPVLGAGCRRPGRCRLYRRGLTGDLSAEVRGECELDEIRSEILDPLRLAAQHSLVDQPVEAAENRLLGAGGLGRARLGGVIAQQPGENLHHLLVSLPIAADPSEGASSRQARASSGCSDDVAEQGADPSRDSGREGVLGIRNPLPHPAQRLLHGSIVGCEEAVLLGREVLIETLSGRLCRA